MEIQKPNTTYKTARYGCCTFSLILDKRHPKKGKETFPVARILFQDLQLKRKVCAF